MRLLPSLVLIATLLSACGNSLNGSSPFSSNGGGADASHSVGGKSLSSDESEILNLVNAMRSESGLNPLVLDASLQNAASAHSLFMAMHDTLTHAEPAPNGTSGNRIENAGGDFNFSGENVAENSGDAAQTFENWMSSSGHRANILSSNYNSIGISRSGNYWTDFGGR